MKKESTHPRVGIVLAPVDNGKAVIGVIDCPSCGREHFTVNFTSGLRRIRCGKDLANNPGIDDDGFSWLDLWVSF